MSEWFGQIDWSIWGAPSAVLLVGAIAGVVLALRAGDRWDHDSARDDLMQRKHDLLSQLRALEADSGKLEPAVYEARREALIAETAAVMKQLEGAVDVPLADKPAEPGRKATPVWTLALQAGALMAFLVVAGVVLQGALKPRAEGGSMTGNSGGISPLEQARQDLEADPTDFEAQCLVAKWAVIEQDLDQAMQSVDAMRALRPDDACTVATLAALNLAIGRVEPAAAALNGLVEAGTLSPWAKIWLGLIERSQGNDEGARAYWIEVIKEPEHDIDQDFASYLLQDLMMPQQPQQPTTGPVAEGPPAIAGVVSGAVEGPGVLFIYARTSEVAAGPPLAAVKVADWSLPHEFGLRASDILPMYGMDTWPEQVWISAKISRSGDPAVKSDDDVETAALGPFAPGDVVELELGG